MAKKTAKAKDKYNSGSSLGIENELWEAADKLREWEGQLDEMAGKLYEACETLKVSFVNLRHVWQDDLAYHDA